ncbi:hypothetical protein ACWHA3_02270 [Streptomyces cyaneofuscatus]
MTACDAYRTAQALADHGLTVSDEVTTADLDAAADHAGVDRPTADDRHTIHLALDAITD